ncbi:MAG: hydrogenase maturation protease [Acidobacteria bacterium]|nr:hydrogenase maturation protease [Acidobacteriota bacterium]
MLIAGIGNIFLADDAFGVELAQMLAQRQLPEGMEVRDFGIRGFDLAYAMTAAWDAVILLDAVPRGGDPGTLYVIEHVEHGECAGTALEPHSMDPLRALELARSLGGRIPPTVVIGCEPVTLGGDEGSIGLSTPVKYALQPALELVLKTAERLSSGIQVEQEEQNV